WEASCCRAAQRDVDALYFEEPPAFRKEGTGRMITKPPIPEVGHRTTWAVVASRTGIKIFEKVGRVRKATLVRALEHPEGRLRDQELVSDRPGRSYDSITIGGHVTEPKEKPHDRIASDFARRIAEDLDDHHRRQNFDTVVLIAESKF